MCEVFCEGCKVKYFLYGVEFVLELLGCWKLDCGVFFCWRWFVNFKFLEILIVWFFCCGGGKWGFCREYFRLLLLGKVVGFSGGILCGFFGWFVGVNEFLLF